MQPDYHKIPAVWNLKKKKKIKHVSNDGDDDAYGDYHFAMDIDMTLRIITIIIIVHIVGVIMVMILMVIMIVVMMKRSLDEGWW